MTKEEELLRLLQIKAKGNREVEATYEELASELGLSRRRVGDLLFRLREKGAIRWRRNGRGNRYTLLVAYPQENGRHPMALSPEGSYDYDYDYDGVAVASESESEAEGGYTPEDEYGFPLGRTRELKLLEDYLRKGLSVIVQGDEGVGKTALLKAFDSQAKALHLHREPLYIAQGSPTKEWLVSLAWELVRRGYLKEENFERLRNPVLAFKCLDALEYAGLPWLLILDHCDKLNSTQQVLLEPFLKQWPCILAFSKPKSLRLALPVLELEPLAEEYQEALIELFVEEERIWVEDLELFKRALIRRAKGNLKKLRGLLTQAKVERTVTCRWVHRELGFEKERDYIDATPVILIGIAVFIGIRFLGLGLGDRELYVVAGLGYAAAWILRLYWWRWRKPKRSTSAFG